MGQNYTSPAVGDWYTIGLAAGVGTGIGVLVAGLAGAGRMLLFPLVGVAVAAALGAAGGYAVGDAAEAVGGAIGGSLGAFAGFVVVRGALGRGGTRGGTAALVAAAAVVLGLLALIPAVGYVEAAVAPLLAGRLLRRRGDRYAGLRILARD